MTTTKEKYLICVYNGTVQTEETFLGFVARGWEKDENPPLTRHTRSAVKLAYKGCWRLVVPVLKHLRRQNEAKLNGQRIADFKPTATVSRLIPIRR